MTRLRSHFFLIILFSSICYGRNQIVFYEPSCTTLSGVITELTFPGAPNYESIKNGDIAENGLYLVLRKPIDIFLSRDGDILCDRSIKNVQIIQLLVLPNKNLKDIKKGNRVEITGNLFSPHTGHHHARALLEVCSVKKIAEQKIDNHQLNVTKEDRFLLEGQLN